MTGVEQEAMGMMASEVAAGSVTVPNASLMNHAPAAPS